MSDDDSNDVVIVANNGESAGESTLTETETRPIMQLFQRLISNDNKQNTVLTNAQIISILHKEFNIDITTLHELEVDIYLNIVKRFLKDWPKWDEFDSGINYLRKKNAYKSIKKTLEAKYLDLKNYLRIQLDETKPLAKKAVSQMIEENARQMETVDTSDLILEVYCTRKQLNELVLSQPVSAEVENTIFNLTEFTPTSITVNKLPVDAILNWFGVHVSVDLKNLSYQRWTSHQLKHVLVNTRNNITNNKINNELKCQIQIKQKHTQDAGMDKEKMYKMFDKQLEMLVKDKQVQNNQMLIFQSLMEILRNDLYSMDKVKVPATYRQYSNKYPYCRKLKKDVDSPSAGYDLYVEETLAPMHCFQFGKITAKPNTNKPWFVIKCVECKIKFSGDEMYTPLREHFDVYHSSEPDWYCTHCGRSFTMMELARNKWLHCC